VRWDTQFSSVLDDSNPPFYTWFADGSVNAADELPDCCISQASAKYIEQAVGPCDQGLMARPRRAGRPLLPWAAPPSLWPCEKGRRLLAGI